MPQIIPIKDLKDTSNISAMCNHSKEPIYITKNGYGDMVIMSMKAYEEHLAMLEVYTKLANSESEVREGKVLDARESLSKLREKYNV